MRSFEELLSESSSLHGHRCAGQVLGVRMAMVGCREVGIDEPKSCKKLVVYVEMDRCATDAVQAVTGCSLGKRTLKFLDYGKMAASFVNTETQQAVRVLAKDNARDLVPLYVQDRTNARKPRSKLTASCLKMRCSPSNRPRSIFLLKKCQATVAHECNALNVAKRLIFTVRLSAASALSASLALNEGSCQMATVSEQVRRFLKSC